MTVPAPLTLADHNVCVCASLGNTRASM